MVLDHYENYDLPEKLSDWKTVVTANGFEQATAPLQLMGDKSRQATVELKRLPKNTKPITDEPTQIMAPIPMPKPSTPTTPALSPDDVRTWKVTIFGCTEHVDESMPAAKKIATSLTSKGYQNVVAKRWPLAGTMQTVNGESFYYALPGPFTLNLTSAKAKQAAQLRKDLSSISGLPALADNVVGTEYVRSLTAVVCPGFTEDDRYE
ncbi:hypothetical protein Rleg2_1140 [Rhizobium leguminosarum bv. trifolii WSM2304]|uniref:SPOR domain-containing protein n=2 Tax=Rhizobium leguminosarum TaxID=384 RepID=A0ABF7QKD6_RHILW|nr:hypothetical protein Rleg2_1140 [Rhizobium leguminosarum bv. trifolii WSM2304]